MRGLFHSGGFIQMALLEHDRDHVDEDAPIALPFIDFSKWDHEPIPDRAWAVQDRIPLRQTALFTCEGGTGKSAVTLHLCAAHVLGRDWLGSLPEIGPAIFLDAEDDEREIHIRLACIAKHYDVSLGGADRRWSAPYVLCRPRRCPGNGQPKRQGRADSPVRQVLEAAGDIRPKIIGIASCANVFAEMRAIGRRFNNLLALLTRLAISANGSVQLISHPC